MKNIYSILRDIKKTPKLNGIRKYLNLLYYDPTTVIVNYKNFDYIVVDGFKFLVNDQIDSVQRVKGNPWFEGVRPDDIVLDIGANIGAITIPLAKIAKRVYAVEPLFIGELEQNILLNKLENVGIYPWAIGNATGVENEVEFSSKKGTVPFVTLDYLLHNVIKKQVDFIKIDGEGCEWDFEPKQLKGIREIRIEFHLRRGHKNEDEIKLRRWRGFFKAEKYKVHSSWGKPPLCVPFTACLVLRASKIEQCPNKR